MQVPEKKFLAAVENKFNLRDILQTPLLPHFPFFSLKGCPSDLFLMGFNWINVVQRLFCNADTPGPFCHFGAHHLTRQLIPLAQHF